MLIALYMPNRQVKTYNSHDIPMAFMLTRAEREYSAQVLENMREKKMQNLAVQMTFDKITRADIRDAMALAAMQKKLTEALQGMTHFKAYTEERFGEIGPQDSGIHVIGGGG